MQNVGLYRPMSDYARIFRRNIIIIVAENGGMVAGRVAWWQGGWYGGRKGWYGGREGSMVAGRVVWW